MNGRGSRWVALHARLLRICARTLGEGALRQANADFARLLAECPNRRSCARLLWREVRSLVSTWRRDRRYLGREAWEPTRRPDGTATVLPAKLSLAGRGRVAADVLGRAIRHGARQLIAEPGFSLTCALFLGLGILVATAGFSALNAALWRPEPWVSHPDRLVQIYTSGYTGDPYGPSSYPDMIDVREAADTLSGLMGFGGEQIVVSVDGEEPRRVVGQWVTGGFFETLGVPLLLGRGITDDDVDGDARVAVAGYDFWQRKLGGSPDVLGRRIEIEGKPHTIVGVAPAGMLAVGEPLIVDLWAPLRHTLVEHRNSAGMGVLIGRLAGGATSEQLEAELAGLAEHLADSYPDLWIDGRGNPVRFTVVSMSGARIPPSARGQLLLAVALGALLVGLLLATVCANVATLFLVRAMRQRAAIATRLALGSGRGRIVLELTVQGVLLAALGAAIGLALTSWLAGVLAAGPDSWLGIPVALDLRPDIRVLGFAVLLVVIVGAAFALAPALRVSSLDLATAMKGPAGAGGGGRRGRGKGLVAIQVAASLALLVAAAIVVRGLDQLQRTDLGFEPQGVTLTELDLSFGDYDEAQERAFVDALTRSSGGALTGVAVARTVPLAGTTLSYVLDIDGYEPPPGQVVVVPTNMISPGYFELMGMRLVAGRDFDEDDREGAQLVVIANEAFVSAYGLPANPLGHGVQMDDERAEIVGVVATAKYQSPAEPELPHLWLPYAQAPRPRLFVHARGRGDAAAVLASVREAIHAIDPELPILSTMRLQQVVDDATMGERVLSIGLGAAGVLALGLSVLGIYGSVAHLVGQRRRELSIRMAVGASRGSILRLVLQQGLLLATIGLVAGSALSIGVGQLLRSAITGIGGFEPWSLLLGIAMLALTTLAASLAPALRAARLDPAKALHAE